MERSQFLKRDDVVRLLGDVSDETVAAILASGATHADLEVAYACIMGSDREEGQLGPLAGGAARIYDILQNEPMFAPLDERSD
jgi:hypothetical protein